MLRRFAPVFLLVLALGVPSFPAADALAADKLVVWWNKGYYPEEDAAMQKIVKEFEATHKAEVDLSFTAQEDLLKKITAALIAHRVPDVAFCFYNDWQVVPKFGWDDQLADVSDVIQALRPRYNEKLLPVAFVLNGKTKKRAYYGVPIEAQTMHIHYWRDLLREVGMADDPAKVPMKWDDYWTYWKKAQDALRKKDPAKYGKLYGLGMTESTRASDTLNYFDNMATIEWPDGPDGKKARYLSAVKTIIIPKDSKNPRLAKEFIKFVVEKNRFTEYIKAANGRWFPAFTDVAADPFWRTGHKGPKGQKDMHVPVATTIFLDRENKVFEHYKNPAFSQLYDENVWGKAMARIAIDKWSADRAADEAIERMKAIFAGYK